MMYKATFLVCILLTVAISNNVEAVSIDSIIADVNAEFKDIPTNRKKAMAALFINKYRPIGPDKLHTFEEQFRDYILRNRQFLKNCNDDEFGVFLEDHERFVTNYFNLPELTKDQRRSLNTYIEKLTTEIQKIISKAYPDAPDHVRDSIAERFGRNMDREKVRFGNYFYPEYLYISTQDIENSVAKQIQKVPFIHNTAGRYTNAVGHILHNEKYTQEQKDKMVELFIMSQDSIFNASILLAKARNVIFATNMNDYGYIKRSDAFRAKYNKVYATYTERMEKGFLERAKRKQHESFVNKIVNGSHISVRDGFVEMPEYLISVENNLAVSGVEDVIANKNTPPQGETPAPEKEPKIAETGDPQKQNDISSIVLCDNVIDKSYNWLYVVLILFPVLGIMLIFIVKRLFRSILKPKGCGHK